MRILSSSSSLSSSGRLLAARSSLLLVFILLLLHGAHSKLSFVDSGAADQEVVYKRVEVCRRLENVNFDSNNRTSGGGGGGNELARYGILQSPNYPQKYNASENCVYSLQAPRNHIIVLKYYEQFEIEPSDDCIYDYLEIRDGQFGYSPLIGRFCNFSPPQLPIESTGRFLWLNFRSDDLIEMVGFRIIFEFRRVQKQQFSAINSVDLRLKNGLIKCEMKILPNEIHHGNNYLTNAIINSYFERKYNELVKLTTSKNGSEKIPPLSRVSDCLVYIEAKPDERFFLAFEKINIHIYQNNSRELSTYDRVNCTENVLEVYDGTTSRLNKMLFFCIEETLRIYKQTRTNKVFVRWYFTRHLPYDVLEFKLRFSTFSLGPCSNSSYHCSDNKCISKELVCDGMQNCGDDETDCVRLKSASAWHKRKIYFGDLERIWTWSMMHKILLSVISVVLFIFVTVAIAYSCKRSVKLNTRKRKEFQIINLHTPTATLT